MWSQGRRWGGEFPDSDQTCGCSMVSVRDEPWRCSAWDQTQVIFLPKEENSKQRKLWRFQWINPYILYNETKSVFKLPLKMSSFITTVKKQREKCRLRWCNIDNCWLSLPGHQIFMISIGSHSNSGIRLNILLIAPFNLEIYHLNLLLSFDLQQLSSW